VCFRRRFEVKSLIAKINGEELPWREAIREFVSGVAVPITAFPGMSVQASVIDFDGTILTVIDGGNAPRFIVKGKMPEVESSRPQLEDRDVFIAHSNELRSIFSIMIQMIEKELIQALVILMEPQGLRPTVFSRLDPKVPAIILRKEEDGYVLTCQNPTKCEGWGDFMKWPGSE